MIRMTRKHPWVMKKAQFGQPPGLETRRRFICLMMWRENIASSCTRTKTNSISKRQTSPFYVRTHHHTLPYQSITVATPWRRRRQRLRSNSIRHIKDIDFLTRYVGSIEDRSIQVSKYTSKRSENRKTRFVDDYNYYNNGYYCCCWFYWNCFYYWGDSPQR